MYNDQKDLNFYLLQATERVDCEKMHYWINKKAQINAVTNHCLPTVVAVSRRNIKCLELLIENKADLNLEGCPSQYLVSSYMTPLALAVGMGEKKIVSFLCKNNSDLCLQGRGLSNIKALREYPGRGALEWGIVYFQEECVKKLLECAKKQDEKRVDTMVCQDYFCALKEGEYKEYVRNFLRFFLILKKNKKSRFYRIPKPLFLEIIKQGINPYTTLYSMITNKSSMVEYVDTDLFAYPSGTTMIVETTPLKLAEKIFLETKNNEKANAIRYLLDYYLNIATMQRKDDTTPFFFGETKKYKKEGCCFCVLH